MDVLPAVILTIVIVVVVIVILWVLFWWLFRRATKEVAFVRTGLGGQKVVQNGGAFVIPVLHDLTPVSMSTNRLEITREDETSIITRDRMRIDVTAMFYVRVASTPEAIALAAQALGSKTARPEAMRELLEGRFVDALRSVAAEMTMEELHEQRGDFIRRVKAHVSAEVQQTGLELESASLTQLDQTSREFFDPNNAFDAEGLTRLTADIESRRLKRNAIEQDSRVNIQTKNLESETRRLELDKQEEYARLAQQEEIAVRRAEQGATISSEEASRRRFAEEARVAAQLSIDLATARADQQREVERLSVQKAVERETAQTRQAIEDARTESEQIVELRRIEREKQTAMHMAAKNSEVARATAERNRESEEARVAAELEVRIASLKADEGHEMARLGAEAAIAARREKNREEVDGISTGVDKAIRLARIAKEHAVAMEEAARLSEVSQEQARRQREADAVTLTTGNELERIRVELARLLDIDREEADRLVALTRTSRKEAVSRADMESRLAIDTLGIEQQQKLIETEHLKDVALSESAKAQIEALADVERARRSLVEAEEALTLLRAREREEREKVIALIKANSAAESDVAALLVSAEARVREATDMAKANEVETRSKAARITAMAEAEAIADKARIETDAHQREVDADAVRALTEAENTMSGELMALKVRLSVIDHLKDIIRESARPMENIDDIKIVEVNGLVGGQLALTGGGMIGGDGNPQGPQNLPDQVVNSALRYRTQAPVVDSLLSEIGLGTADAKGVSAFLKQGLSSPDPEAPTPPAAAPEKP